MRDILFRGKRVDNGEWIYGNLYQFEEDSEGYVRNLITPKKRDGSPYMVDDKTVGQYSGLNDANDVNIYEGDIIKTTDYFGKQRLFLVCFENGIFLADTSALRSWLNPSFALEVVGNIHDNPDMLTNEGGG